MAEYRLIANPEGSVQHQVPPDGPVTTIPNDPLNTDWIEYQEWLAAGGVPDPVPPIINPALDARPARTTAQILGV
jgi:hypothetical protein